jgi:phosphinothricin acetyltransferase
MGLTIRDVAEADTDAIASIYGHHVLTGTASYDLEPPPPEFHRSKIRRIAGASWPFLVAEVDGEIAGYAYVTQFRDRAAYRFTAEDSIYVHPQKMGHGIGKALLGQLLDRAAEHGFRTVIAVIGGAEPASIALHRGLGFREAGRLTAVGFKFGRWLDSVYMQRELICALSDSS